MKPDEPRFWAMAMVVPGSASLAWACFARWEMLTSVLVLFGASLGWMTGTLAVPLSKVEDGRFRDLAKVISGFLSGYALSKIDPLVSALVQVDPVTRTAQIAQPDVAIRTVLCLTSYVIGLLVVFCARSYWSHRAD